MAEPKPAKGTQVIDYTAGGQESSLQLLPLCFLAFNSWISFALVQSFLAPRQLAQGVHSLLAQMETEPQSAGEPGLQLAVLAFPGTVTVQYPLPLINPPLDTRARTHTHTHTFAYSNPRPRLLALPSTTSNQSVVALTSQNCCSESISGCICLL